MTLSMFFISAVLISLSGVMAPGPITAATIAHGNKNPYAGIWIAVGHGIVEFPLIIIIFLGFGSFIKQPLASAIIALAGGAFLVQIGYSMLKTWKKSVALDSQNTHTPLMTGIILSIGNPYFLIWWATVGATLIINAVKFSLIILVVFAIVHWSIDLIWYVILSSTTFKIGNIWGEKFSKGITLICGIALVIFGFVFIFSAIHTFGTLN
jgi:threonine/homoserine/homoserine lactone efflux protein